jgi:hypothetical protein
MKDRQVGEKLKPFCRFRLIFLEGERIGCHSRVAGEPWLQGKMPKFRYAVCILLAFSLKQQARKFYHLGLTAVPRSTLADANKQRPAVIFEKTYYSRVGDWPYPMGRDLMAGMAIKVRVDRMVFAG